MPAIFHCYKMEELLYEKDSNRNDKVAKPGKNKNLV